MNRRTFITRTGAVAILALPSLGLLSGCPSNVTQTTLEALVTEMATAWAALAPYLKGVSASLVGAIAGGLSGLEAAVKAWTPGKAITDIETIVNAIVANLNLIPGASQYEGLIVLLVATAEGILAILVPGPASNVMVTARGVMVGNPPRTERQFHAGWNGEIRKKGLPKGLEIN
jgi:hypothetical protein